MACSAGAYRAAKHAGLVPPWCQPYTEAHVGAALVRRGREPSRQIWETRRPVGIRREGAVATAWTPPPSAAQNRDASVWRNCMRRCAHGHGYVMPPYLRRRGRIAQDATCRFRTVGEVLNRSKFRSSVLGGIQGPRKETSKTEVCCSYWDGRRAASAAGPLPGILLIPGRATT